MKHLFLVTVIFLLISPAAFGQTAPAAPSAEMTAATKLIQENKWPEAEKAFLELVKTEQNNARAWFYLGFARHSQEKWEAAIEAFKKNVEIGKGAAGMYNVAAGYARMNKKDEAFEWLEKALKNGAAFTTDINADVDFENIRPDARFKQMLELVEQQKNPCLYSEEARQFDFWIGDWDVYVNGNKVGENLVEREVAGCTLVENWKSRGGQTGKSLNAYNPSTKKWKQFYVGSQGGVLEFEGVYKDKILHLEGESLAANGTKIINILEFHDLPDKSVRQLWKQSTDAGKTWSVVWDGIYKRKEK
jgi:tetratricopeptide (TPR) repeat protein